VFAGWVAGGDGRMVVGADGRVVVDRQAVNGGVDLLNDSLDTLSGVGINDIEKVEDSIEENFVNDLNDLNDNLNEVAHDIKEDAVHMDKPKDTYTDQQHEYMEDKGNNTPNASRVGESSDPSYPPGFEFMKRSFSNTSLIDLPVGVLKVLLDIRIIALDRLWSYHTPLLFNVSKTDFGPSPFKLYNSWLSRDGFDEVIKSTWSSLGNMNAGKILRSHEKLWYLNIFIKQWYVNVKNSDRTRKQEVMIEIHGIEKRNDDGNATPINQDKRVQILSEIDKLDNFVALDLIQKAHINRMVFPSIVHSSRLNSLDRELLEANVSLDEIKSAIWDCGSNKAQGPDGFSFAFVKKYWVFIKTDILEFINSFFESGLMPQGANSLFFTLTPKVSNLIFIEYFWPISLIGINYTSIAKVLANLLSKVIDKIVSKEQSAFIAGHQILDGPFILSEVIQWFRQKKKKMLINKSACSLSKEIEFEVKSTRIHVVKMLLLSSDFRGYEFAQVYMKNLSIGARDAGFGREKQAKEETQGQLRRNSPAGVTPGFGIAGSIGHTSNANSEQENMAKVQDKILEDDVEKIVEGEDEESYASEFADSVFLNDEEDSGTRLEPGSHNENPKTVDDDDEEEKKDDKKDDDDNDDYDDHAPLRNKVTCSLEELTATVSPTPTTTSQDRSKSKHISSKYKHIRGALHRICRRRATNDLIEDNLKSIVDNNVIQERDSLQAEVPALISKEFADHAPKIIEELFKTHMKNNVITVHPTTSTSTATITSADLKQQLYLKMKRNLQDQSNDLELWDVLKRKFEKSSTSHTSCRNDAFCKRDHDNHQEDNAPPKGEKRAKRHQKVQNLQDPKLMYMNISNNNKNVIHGLRRQLSMKMRNSNETYLYNKDLFFLKYGNSKERNYVLSLHMIHVVPFPEEDLEEKMNCWLNQRKVKKNPEEYFSNHKIVEVVRITTDQQHGLDYMEQIIMIRENDKLDSFSEADFKYLNKNDIEDMYYFCLNKKLGIESYQIRINLTTPTLIFSGIEACDPYSVVDKPTTSLIYLKSKEETMFLKKDPLLGGLDLDIMKAYEREITKHLRHHEQMRRWESFLNRRSILPMMRRQ
ncbi:hypothetical protein Tco_1569189, partial [Tanacetum coccineum]